MNTLPVLAIKQVREDEPYTNEEQYEDTNPVTIQRMRLSHILQEVNQSVYRTIKFRRIHAAFDRTLNQCTAMLVNFRVTQVVTQNAATRSQFWTRTALQQTLQTDHNVRHTYV